MAAETDTLRRTPLHDRHVAAGAKLVDISSGMKPCLVSSSSWMMSGRSSDRAYENGVNQKPGRSSSVMAAPPTRWRRSRISVFRPPRAR